jgi:6-phosphogluconate dehydrogenase
MKDRSEIMSEKKADIGLIGLAVMGQNLVLNMNDNGYTVAVFNRTYQKTQDFMKGPANGRETILSAQTLEEFVGKLAAPRKVMLMVKAGDVVDLWIDKLMPLLDKGDLIIDGGNSHFPDTIRRHEKLKAAGLLYIGTGVSGGEEGARRGPSIMPGGEPAAWPLVKPILQDISAKTDEGEPCCDWVGEGGAGHYVKMVHNGIEYGDMQLITEAYQLMKQGLGMNPDEMHDVFAEWNTGVLDSYLIEITRDILGFKDEKGEALVEKILDTAGQKGTGKWTGVSALELGVPVTLIGEAVFSRCLSALKEERVAASKVLTGPTIGISGTKADKKAFVDDLEQALLASKIVSYAQGYMLMREAAKEYGWNLNYGGIALMWQGGCIIRSVFLGEIKKAYDENPELHNLLLADYFKNAVDQAQASWRRVIAKAVELGIPRAGDVRGPGVLRRLSQRETAGQPAPGSAGLLWSPYL